MNTTNEEPTFVIKETVEGTYFDGLMRHQLKEQKIKYVSWLGCLIVAIILYLHFHSMNLAFFPRPIQWICVVGTVATLVLQLYHRRKAAYYYDKYMKHITESPHKE